MGGALEPGKMGGRAARQLIAPSKWRRGFRELELSCAPRGQSRGGCAACCRVLAYLPSPNFLPWTKYSYFLWGGSQVLPSYHGPSRAALGCPATHLRPRKLLQRLQRAPKRRGRVFGVPLYPETTEYRRKKMINIWSYFAHTDHLTRVRCILPSLGTRN